MPRFRQEIGWLKRRDPSATITLYFIKVVFYISYLKSFFEKRTGSIAAPALLIIAFAASIFMPFILTPLPLVGITVYFIADKNTRSRFTSLRFWPFTLALFALLLIVPAIYGNWLGLACGAIICMLLLCSVFMRMYMTKSLFELITDIACGMSLIGVFVAFIEQVTAFLLYGNMQHRSFSIYINANYFATICVFVMFICVYKLVKPGNKRPFYWTVMILNGTALYFTNCRSAFIPLFVGILILLAMNRRFKLLFILLGVFSVLIILAFSVSWLFPRLEDLGGRTYSVRKTIWDTALSAISDKPLFGRGALSFPFVHEEYSSAVQLHAHSIYFEFPMSFGLIGTALFILYFAGVAADISHDIRIGKEKLCGLGLAMAVFAAVLIHGITDFTLLGPHTPFLFLLLLSYPTSRFSKESVPLLTI